MITLLLLEAEVDERMQQVVDMEDPDIVVDLRHHNRGAPSKYDPFWDECAKARKKHTNK